ncbi:DUF4365 domain-containing protein [Vibrio harveyi]|nr:DUF4365 domain-containing protein [Vibrio harveyi]MCG9547218.1 DUF4365 domain-containing protein [Vibrio harveyi]
MRSKSHLIDEKSINLIKGQLIDNWVVRDAHGRDYGVDLQLERFDVSEPTGDFIFVQVKGTEKEFDENIVLNNFPVKTINYALLFSVPFFVFYTSVTSKKTKYIWLQKYVDSVLDVENKKWKKQKTVTLKFPDENDITTNMQKISSISKMDKKIKIAHKCVMWCERYLYSYEELKGGNASSGRKCFEFLYMILKGKYFEQFGGHFLLGQDEKSRKDFFVNCASILDDKNRCDQLDQEQLDVLEQLYWSIKMCKQFAVNIEVSESISNWLNDKKAY